MTMHPDIHAMLAAQRTGELINQAYRSREQRRARTTWRKRLAARRRGGALSASPPRAAPAR